MTVYADNVQETTTSSGTGAITLAGAVAKFRTFASAVPSGSPITIGIETRAGREVCDAVFTAPSTLSRGTFRSSTTGARLSLAGVSKVYLTQAASDIVDTAALNAAIAANPGPVGPAGPAGATGPQGPPGDAGSLGPSLAGGSNTTALGTNAIAWGDTNAAGGAQSATFGKDNVASGLQAFAAGNDCAATGARSVCVGHESEASNTFCVTIGAFNVCHGTASVLIGEYLQCSSASANAIALGYASTIGAYADFGVVIGSYCSVAPEGGISTYATGAVAIGISAVAKRPGHIQFSSGCDHQALLGMIGLARTLSATSGRLLDRSGAGFFPDLYSYSCFRVLLMAATRNGAKRASAVFEYDAHRMVTGITIDRAEFVRGEASLSALGWTFGVTASGNEIVHEFNPGPDAVRVVGQVTWQQIGSLTVIPATP